MTILKKVLAGSVGFAAIVGAASPAAAQYYPGGNYGGYGSYGNSPGNVVGQVINGVIAATQYGSYQYGNYGYGQSYGYRGQTIQANVAVSQCASAVEARLNGGYGGGYGGGGYGGGYGSYGQGGRVSGITSIEGRNNGALRVHGVISTMAGGYGGGYNSGYGYGGGYGGGYNNGGYNNGGYGAPNLSFTCKVDYSGRVIDLGIEQYRPNYGYRGY